MWTLWYGIKRLISKENLFMSRAINPWLKLHKAFCIAFFTTQRTNDPSRVSAPLIPCCSLWNRIPERRMKSKNLSTAFLHSREDIEIRPSRKKRVNLQHRVKNIYSPCFVNQLQIRTLSIINSRITIVFFFFSKSLTTLNEIKIKQYHFITKSKVKITVQHWTKLKLINIIL